MNRKPYTFRSLWMILLILCLGIAACGKKSPPLPPIQKGGELVAPVDVKYLVNNNLIHLNWKYDKKAKAKPDGFEVFMAKKGFTACEGCPFEFNSIGVAAIPATQFSVNIQKGFKYYFRVRAISGNGMTSEFSKTVQYEYK